MIRSLELVNSLEDKRQVYGYFKSTNGYPDKDVIYGAYTEAIKVLKSIKSMSKIYMVFGIIFSITIIGALLGVPLIFISNKNLKKNKKRMALIEEAYVDFCNGKIE